MRLIEVTATFEDGYIISDLEGNKYVSGLTSETALKRRLRARGMADGVIQQVIFALKLRPRPQKITLLVPR